jgi:hypothetical protein
MRRIAASKATAERSVREDMTCEHRYINRCLCIRVDSKSSFFNDYRVKANVQ